MPTLHELLSAEHLVNNEWRFTVPTELHGAFGGAFGGIVASCCLIAARAAAPGRTPNALDCRFVRGLVAGEATARATVLHAGRSLSNVSVDLSDATDRLCARAMISLVCAGVLHDFADESLRPSKWTEHDDAPPWPAIAPIVAAIDPRNVGEDDRGLATSVLVPWDDDGHGAEAASMACDMAVGPPLGSSVPRPIGTPNPDLSIRFCGEVTGRHVIGVGRMDRAGDGVAAVRIEAWSQNRLVALAISTALLLPAP